MPYVIDRQRAVYTPELVVIASISGRRVRSRVILADNSLYQTLTRPKTLLRRLQAYPAGLGGRGRAARRTDTGVIE